jgi:hypothetical protein
MQGRRLSLMRIELFHLRFPRGYRL